MTYNVFGGTLNLAQSINQSTICDYIYLKKMQFLLYAYSCISLIVCY